MLFFFCFLTPSQPSCLGAHPGIGNKPGLQRGKGKGEGAEWFHQGQGGGQVMERVHGDEEGIVGQVGAWLGDLVIL